MKKRHYLFLILTTMIFIISIHLNITTINNAEQRIIEEKQNTPISELLPKEEQIAEEIATEEKDTMVEKKTNSYTNEELAIVIITSLVASTCFVLLIFTSLGKISILEMLLSRNRLSYGILTLLILGVSSSTINVILTDKLILNSSNTVERNEKSVAVIEITKNKEVTNLKKESNKNDTSVLQVSNQSTYKANKVDLVKTGGKSTDKEITEYFGLNSAVIVKDSSTLGLNDSNISSNSSYSNAIFLTGLGTSANLNKVTLSTTNNNSSGISISDEATATAEDIKLSTNGNESSAIKTLDPNSSITINKATINTIGNHSPLFYSTGKITVSNTTGNSSDSPIGIIKGPNLISISNSQLSTNANSEEIKYQSAFTIYKDLASGSSNDFNVATLAIEESTISINKESGNYKKVPLFYVENAKAKINITDSKLKYGSNTLINVISEDNNNQSEVTITATDQTIKGNVIADENSKIKMYLNNSTFKGQINKGNKAKNIDVIFDENSRWTLTGTSYVNTLTVTKKDLNNVTKYIRSNGYNIYYNAKNNEWLNGRTIILNGGGKLIPKYYKS